MDVQEVVLDMVGFALGEKKAQQAHKASVAGELLGKGVDEALLLICQLAWAFKIEGGEMAVVEAVGFTGTEHFC